jgi:hypothetical protein
MNMKSATKFSHLVLPLWSNRSPVSTASKVPLAESAARDVLATRALLTTRDADAGPGPAGASA